MLKDKSLFDLRAIAQSFDIPDIMAKDADRLRHEIELKQVAKTPEPPVEIPRPSYDARLMTKPPSKFCTKVDALKLLEKHIANGLSIRFPDEEVWEMWCGDKTDTGSMRIPLRVLLNCADKMLK